MTEPITIDNIHEHPITNLLVGSLSRFWDFCGSVTPQPLRDKTGKPSVLLGMEVLEDHRLPPNLVAFRDQHGNLVGLINMDPKPPEMVDA